jgi:Tfp pilus assembly protein PilN
MIMPMDSRVTPSFIPKRPISGSGQPARSSASGGLFYSLASLIFVTALVAAATLYGYELYLNQRIGSMQSSLDNARQNLDPGRINFLARADARLKSASNLLKDHVALSVLFKRLEALTLQTVRFNTFAFETKNEGIELRLKGEARSYSAVALQEQTMAADPMFSSVVFSDLDLNERGNVIFSMKAMVRPQAVAYENTVNTPAPVAPVAAPVAEPVLPVSTTTQP